MYVCICHAVTRSEFDQVVAEGATNLRAVGERCGAGTGCGSCRERLSALLSGTEERRFAFDWSARPVALADSVV